MVQTTRQDTKIIIAQITKDWGTKAISWASDELIPKFNQCGKTIAVAVFPQSEPLAFAKACNHPNALVLLEGEENGYAIEDFFRRQKFTH